MNNQFKLFHYSTNKNYILTVNYDNNSYKINTSNKEVLTDFKNDFEVNFNNSVYKLFIEVCNTPILLNTNCISYEFLRD